MPDLISIAEARARVLDAVWPLPSETASLRHALGRVLAQDVASEVSVPPFDSSAMDGYAVFGDRDGELELIGEARAGHPAEVELRPGTAIAVSTGAAVPRGTFAVVPVERTRRAGEGRVVVESPVPGANVRRSGEDVVAGDVVLRAGAVLGPAELGVAASIGRAELLCARRPRVAILVTGDELTDPGEPLPPGGIYSSNGYALAAQVERAGAQVAALERVADSPEATRAALERRARAAPTSWSCRAGSRSARTTTSRARWPSSASRERFWGVGLRPGKPTWFGARGETLAFGLPGNPVSAMVTFQLFARPALAALQGADPAATRAEALLDAADRAQPAPGAGGARAPRAQARGAGARSRRARRRARTC